VSYNSKITQRQQSRGEELANAVSHGVALLVAIVATPVLIISAVRAGEVSAVIGASIFGGTMLMLYLASTIYHALPTGKAKRIFMIIDHCAIFLLIAGTYTPFTLGVLRGSWGWSLFGVVWGLCLIGILLKAFFGTRYQLLSLCLYLTMGWLVVVAAQPVINAVPVPGLFWLLAGGVAYTAGVLFFLLDNRVRYAHFVWHLFVLTGTSCHFVAVFSYAA
jgi:hemolysin III